jgi:hypothetical protein
MLKIGVTEISWWNFSSFEMFIFKEFMFRTSSKAPSLETSPVHQFTSKVNQFHTFCCVDLTRQSHGTKRIFFYKVPNWFPWSFGSILMHHNFGGWFLLGCVIYSLVFSVMSFNSFCSLLWKVTSSSKSILSCFSRFGLLTWPTSTFSCKTYSIIFFILLVSTIGIL